MNPTTTMTLAATMLMTLSAAQAGTETQEHGFRSAEGATHLAITPVDPFDDFSGLRTLTAVEVRLEGSFSAHITMENESHESCPDAAIAFIGDLSVIGPGHMLFSMDDVALPDRVLGPTDGVPGKGDDFYDFGTIDLSGSDSRSPDPADFLGSEPVAMYVFTERTVLTSGVSPAHVDIVSYEVQGTLKVIYTFEGPVLHPDLDGSGAVDYGDVVQVLAAWGEDAGSGADITGDDVVDMHDLLEVLSNWGLKR